MLNKAGLMRYWSVLPLPRCVDQVSGNCSGCGCCAVVLGRAGVCRLSADARRPEISGGFHHFLHRSQLHSTAFFILSSAFPLTTNTTHYHSSWSRNRTSSSCQASPECSYPACQKILRSPRSTTRCIRKRPKKGVPEKVSWSFLVIPLVDMVLYRALRLHPDKGGDPELFKEVTHA